MLAIADVTIESARLRLVPTSRTYAKETFAEFTKEITTFMHPKAPDAIEETFAYLELARGQIERGTDLPVVILLKPAGEFLGHGGLHDLKGSTPELGIWIKKPAHGHGYGREALTAVAYWALDNLSFNYLIYPVDRRNTPSRKIPESLGGIVEAEYEATGQAGNKLDLIEYRIYPSALIERRQAEQVS